MIHVYLVRHGATDWTDENKLQGSTDNPLSVKGKREAKSTGQNLKSIDFDAVFSSPMVRAVETAEIICKKNGKTPIIIDDLHEIDFGIYEGKPFSVEPINTLGWWKKSWLMIKWIIAQITGEILLSVRLRANRSWKEIKKICPCGNILIVSHGLILGYLVRYILPKEKYDEIKSTHFNPCSITEITISPQQPTKLISINNSDHLK